MNELSESIDSFGIKLNAIYVAFKLICLDLACSLINDGNDKNQHVLNFPSILDFVHIISSVYFFILSSDV